MAVRKIKFANITMKDGVQAILSTVELEPGRFETMLMSPDGDEEYVQLRTTSEAQAIGDFNHLRKTYEVKPLTGKYAKLAEDLKAAAAIGLEAAERSDDGGTCNMDAASLSLPRWNQDKVEQAARAAGVGCSTWTLYGHKRYVFSLCCGQGNKRMYAAEAMTKALEDMGYDAFTYCQID